MAKKGKSKRGLRKIEPAVRKLFFSLPLKNAELENTVRYIDISQCASIVNRRFYRQGINWAVAGIRIHTNSSTTGTVNVYKIQETWMAANSWVKSKALWDEMNDLVLDNQPSMKPRYHDFKVHMDSDHINNTFAENLIPYNEDKNGVQTEYLEGEWLRSLIEMPNTAPDGSPDPGETEAYALKMHGADSSSSKAMLQGYADSRAVPFNNDPTTPAGSADGWMNNLLDMGDVHDDIADNLRLIGEDLPYDQFEYPGGGANAVDPALHAIGIVSPTTIGGQTSIEGGTFYCGLVKIVNDLVDSDDPLTRATACEVELILVPGNHRGYMCQKMEDL
ncbi:MAG: hypothetical protein [Circular genetic element sp.]|nr:MAG: hypothetical protein [Circular genetic element sp.]